MIKIGIELNGIVRDLNTQIIKYYKKDINPDFEESKVNKNVLNVINNLNFESKKSKKEFLYVDYPYEIYGCAKTMERNLASFINQWVKELENYEDNDYQICLFSLIEEGLTIQSTYFFLSKIGTRVREMYFPKDSSKMWDICDVIITTNENIIKTKPQGKKVILITKDDNKELLEYSDFSYEKLSEIISDKEFIDKINTNDAVFKEIKENKIKKLFNKFFKWVKRI